MCCLSACLCSICQPECPDLRTKTAMPDSGPEFSVRIASGPADLQAAQRLRYDVFVEELGGGGVGVDHASRLERDEFDPFVDHLLLTDTARGVVAGVYRLMRQDQAEQAGRFYTEGEYDLTPLKTSGKRLLELGRSCLHPDYRGGMAMYHLWNGLADYVATHDIQILFGVASFHGTDVGALAHPLSLLHHKHLAPPHLRPRAVPAHYQAMDLIPPDQIDRKRAMLETPALIKAYLRVGGVVGDGAFVDHAFNTTDVCLVLDTASMTARQRQRYAGSTA